LKRYAELAAEKRAEILPYYRDHFSRISTEDSTISLELTSFLLVMCDVLEPMRILDLGSGFSSFVFRHYMLSASPKPVVWSTDDTEEWLEKTRSFSNYHDYPSMSLLNSLRLKHYSLRSFTLDKFGRFSQMVCR
jgi:hypothetical protein